MTTNESFDRRLSAWLVEESEHRVPDHLAEVLVRTAATRQRPAWSSLERWLHVETTLRARFVAPSGALAAVVLLALLLALAGAALIGAFKPQPVPGIGLARNGLIAWVDGSTIKVVGQDGKGTKALVQNVAGATGLRWSVQGARLAFRTAGPAGAVTVVDPASGHATTVSGSIGVTGDPSLSWSPDGSLLVFASGEGAAAQLYIARADGSSVTPLSLAASPGLSQPSHPEWSPDGRSISFFARNAAGDAALYVVAPDGSSPAKVSKSPANDDPSFGGGSWAPTLGHHWLVYVSGDNVSAPSSVLFLDVDTSKEYLVGTGFWPSWSPDGNHMAALINGSLAVINPSVLVTPTASMTSHAIQPTGAAQTCRDNPELAGRALCAIPVWSPDGRFVAGPDMIGGSFVILSVDGSVPPISIPLSVPAASGEAPAAPAAWQPVAP